MPAPETGATSDRVLEAQALALLGPLLALLLGFLADGPEGGLVTAGRALLVLAPLVGLVASAVAWTGAEGDAATLQALAAVGFLLVLAPGLHVWSTPPADGAGPGGPCQRTGLLPASVGAVLAPEGPAYLILGVALVAMAVGGVAMTPHRRAAVVLGAVGIAVPLAAFAASTLDGCPTV